MDKRGASLVLLSIFLFQLIPLLTWIHEDNSPPSWDQSWHAMISLNRFNQIFTKNPLPTSQVEETYPIFRFVNNFYPPLYHTATIPYYLLFGKNYDAALTTNTLFLLILIVSSFCIGKKIHSPEAGLLIAFIVSTIPGYNLLMRDYLIDFPLVSMVSLGFALLLYTENFQNTAYSLWFGIALGLGMLTKWTYGAFLFLPICLSVLKSLGRSICERRGYRPLGNACLSFVVAFVVMSTWYTFSQLSVLVPLLATASSDQGRVEGEPSFDSLGD